MSYFKANWIDEYLPKEIIRVVFDIGSKHGHDGLVFKNKFPKARVIAIEADDVLYNKIAGDPRMKRLEVFNYAIFDKDGVVEFHYNRGKCNGSGSVFPPDPEVFKFDYTSSFGTQMVESIRIDTLCEKIGIDNIDIIHMDIQGAEYNALIGLGDMRPKMIFLEVGYKYYKGASSPISKLRGMGYKHILNIKGDQLWVYAMNKSSK